MERAVNQIKRLGQGKKIELVETTEDSIVFSETTHTVFVSILSAALERRLIAH